jgi:hemoglobin/transferrin/lactoferrin receptor protein
LSLDLAAYHASGTNRESGAPINSVGPPQAVVGLSWRSADERRHLHFRATFTDRVSKLDESGGALFKPPGYAVLDVYLLQQIGDSLNVRAGLHNLADRTYWRWTDVRGLPPDDPMLPYLARAGRSISFSMNFNW